VWVSLVAVAVLATDGTHAQGLGGAGGGPAPGSPVPPTSRERSSPAEPGPSPRNIVVDLSPRLVPGEVTTWRMTTTSRNQAEGGAMGLPTASDLTQEITIRAEVLQTEDGSRLAELTFQRVKIRYEAEGIRIEADSATRPSPAPAPRPQRPAEDLDRLIDEQARRLQGVMDTAVRQLASTRLRVRFTASGEVEAVEGGEALSVAGPLGALGLAGGVTGAQEATNVFGPIVVRQPGTGGATVRVGERWTTISDLQLQPLGGVRLRSDYELRSVKGTRALVSMRSDLDPSSEATDAPMQVRSIRRVGTFTWDAEHRRLESMDSELELHVGAGTAAGMPELRSRAVTRLERLAEERPR
jgi:hypothetical protein